VQQEAALAGYSQSEEALTAAAGSAAAAKVQGKNLAFKQLPGTLLGYSLSCSGTSFASS
jgi:hypothetical protein